MKIMKNLGIINNTLFHLCFFGFLIVLLYCTIDNSKFSKGGDIFILNRNLSEEKIEDYKKSSSYSSLSSRLTSTSSRSTPSTSSTSSTSTPSTSTLSTSSTSTPSTSTPSTFSTSTPSTSTPSTSTPSTSTPSTSTPSTSTFSTSTSSPSSSTFSTSTSSPSSSTSWLDDYKESSSNVDITEEEEEEEEIDSVHEDNNKGNVSYNIYYMLCSSNNGGYGCEYRDIANYILKYLDIYDENEAKKRAENRLAKISNDMSKLSIKLKSKDPNMFNRNKIIFNDLSKKRTWKKYELHLFGLKPGKYNNEKDVELNNKLIKLEDGCTDIQYIRRLYSSINENEKNKFEDVKRKILYYCREKNKSLHRTRKESDEAWKYCEKLIKLYYNNFDKHFEKVFLIWLALSEGFNVFEYRMLIAANKLLWRKLSNKVQSECKLMILDR